jgi:hypothetical protein
LALLLPGCSLFSSKARLSPLAKQGHWEGRLQLRILQEKPEQFSFNFDLQGSAEAGELTIYSPVGSTVAVASWTPSGAVLTEGNKQTQFESMEVLTMRLTGAALPLPTLMAWLNSDGPALVYDYLVGKWSVHDNHEQSHALLTDDGYTLARVDGSVWQRSDGFTDGDGGEISMLVRTPWVKLSGLQGFQRLFYVSVLGEWRSNHTLTMRVFYDYAQDAAETVTFEATSAAHGYTVGDALQFRHHLGRKCQSVMFELSDNAAGEGLKLTSMALEVGVKSGTARQSTSKTA